MICSIHQKRISSGQGVIPDRRCKPERYIPNPFLILWTTLIHRCHFWKGDSPSAKWRLVSMRSRGSEIFDPSGMDDWFRQFFMKQMG